MAKLKESSAQFPWRRVKFKRSRSRIGTACAQVRVKECWYDIEIEMDVEGFKALADMPERDRYLLLDSLATMPVRHGYLNEHRGGLKGRNAQAARRNAQWLGPLYLDLFKQCARLRKIPPNSETYERVLDEIIMTGYYGKIEHHKKGPFLNRILSIYQNTLDAMRKDSQAHRTPYGMAAYLVEKQWYLSGERWPSARTPTDDPEQYFKVLERNNPFAYKNPEVPKKALANLVKYKQVIPKYLDQLIEDVLAGRPIQLLPAPTIPRFMTDFQ